MAIRLKVGDTVECKTVNGEVVRGTIAVVASYKEGALISVDVGDPMFFRCVYIGKGSSSTLQVRNRLSKLRTHYPEHIHVGPSKSSGFIAEVSLTSFPEGPDQNSGPEVHTVLLDREDAMQIYTQLGLLLRPRKRS